MNREICLCRQNIANDFWMIAYLSLSVCGMPGLSRDVDAVLHAKIGDGVGIFSHLVILACGLHRFASHQPAGAVFRARFWQSATLPTDEMKEGQLFAWRAAALRFRQARLGTISDVRVRNDGG